MTDKKRQLVGATIDASKIVATTITSDSLCLNVDGSNLDLKVPIEVSSTQYECTTHGTLTETMDIWVSAENEETARVNKLCPRCVASMIRNGVFNSCRTTEVSEDSLDKLKEETPQEELDDDDPFDHGN